MGTHWSVLSAIILTFAALAAGPTELRAQDAGGSTPGVPQQAAAVLTGDQQSAANSALCSALGSHFPNTASVGPSALSDPAVMYAAASSFAGSTHLPLPSATELLKGYVAQHATNILASCATSNATSMGFLVPVTGGLKQLSAAGEQFIRALPDREAAKGAMKRARPRRPRRRKKN